MTGIWSAIENFNAKIVKIRVSCPPIRQSAFGPNLSDAKKLIKLENNITAPIGRIIFCNESMKSCFKTKWNLLCEKIAS